MAYRKCWLVPSLNPADPDGPQRVGERRLEVERLPLTHGVQVLHQRRQQSDPEPAHWIARLVARLVLVEAQVGVARRLPDVEAERLSAARVAQQDDVDVVRGPAFALGRCAQAPGRPGRVTQPGRSAGHGRAPTLAPRSATGGRELPCGLSQPQPLAMLLNRVRERAVSRAPGPNMLPSRPGCPPRARAGPRITPGVGFPSRFCAVQSNAADRTCVRPRMTDCGEHGMFRSVDVATSLSIVPGNDADLGGTLDFVVIDVETACSRVSSICQIGVVGFRDGREAFAYETLVDPCDEFSPFNTRIHGITSDHILGKPTFAHVHGTINAHLSGRVTVAHSFFDKGALAAACRVHEQQAVETTWLDSVRVAKRAWPDLPSHRLNVLTRFLGIRHKHHDALSDARAAGMVVVRAIDHTGIDLAGWLRPVNPRSGPAPKPAADGPLKGHRVAILGATRDGTLAAWLAASGARVVASVGTTSTMLVISEDQPFGRFVHVSAPYRRAEEIQRTGVAIEIVREDLLRERVAGMAWSPTVAKQEVTPRSAGTRVAEGRRLA